MGRCSFEFEDTAELRRDVEQIRVGDARIEPFRFVRIRAQLRRRMDEAVVAARTEAEKDLEGRALLQQLDHARRNEEILAQPSPWAAIRSAQRDAERRELGQRLEKLDRVASRWRRGATWGPGGNSNGSEEA
jgi:hypothetical protein